MKNTIKTIGKRIKDKIFLSLLRGSDYNSFFSFLNPLKEKAAKIMVDKSIVEKIDMIDLYLKDDKALEYLWSKVNRFDSALKNSLLSNSNHSKARTNTYIPGGLSNPYAGIGSYSSRDMTNYDYRESPYYTFQEIWTTFYQTTPVAKRFIDFLTEQLACPFVDLKVREGESKEPQYIKKIGKFVKDKCIKRTYIEAVRQMFLHGGSALYIDTDDVNLYMPLNIKKGSRIAFRLVDKSLMYPAEFDNIFDITKKGFNHPSHWRMIFQPGDQSMPVHESRFIFFIPETLPFYARINQLWWGTPALLCVRKAINIVDRAFISTGNQLQQASMAIFKTKIKDGAINPLGSAMNRNDRLQQALSQNGSFQAFDTNDEIERLEIGNFLDQTAATREIISYVCLANGLSPSLFYGSASGGYHASDTELTNHYNKVTNDQEMYLQAPLDQLFSVISISLFGEKDIIEYEFKTPNTPSKLQLADIGLKNSQKYAILKKIGLPNRVIANQIIRDGDFEELTLDDEKEIVEKMDEFDEIQIQSKNSIEGKDVKDDKNKSKKPTDVVTSSSPESVTSDALK